MSSWVSHRIAAKMFASWLVEREPSLKRLPISTVERLYLWPVSSCWQGHWMVILSHQVLCPPFWANQTWACAHGGLINFSSTDTLFSEHWLNSLYRNGTLPSCQQPLNLADDRFCLIQENFRVGLCTHSPTHPASQDALLELAQLTESEQTTPWRALQRSSQPAPCLQAHLPENHAEQMATDSPAFFSNLCKCLATSSVRECFLIILDSRRVTPHLP